MWSDALFLLLSMVMLTAGAESLVMGSSSLARRMGLTPLVAGLTVVAFGTSSPELVVSLDAAVTGHGDIALGNVLGSNILNIGIILGLTAVICPVAVSLPLIRFDAPIMIAASLLCVGLIGYGAFQRTAGLLLVVLLIAYTAFNIRMAKRQGQEPVKLSETEGSSITRSIYEKGLETGIPVALGGWFCGSGKPGQERYDFVGGYGFGLPIAEHLLEPGEDELIVLERIFFSSSTDGIPGTTVLPVTLS